MSHLINGIFGKDLKFRVIISVNNEHINLSVRNAGSLVENTSLN
jgi:hypothetical protein